MNKLGIFVLSSDANCKTKSILTRNQGETDLPHPYLLGLISCSQIQHPRVWKEKFSRSCYLIHFFEGCEVPRASSSIYLEKLYQSEIKKNSKKELIAEKKFLV